MIECCVTSWIPQLKKMEEKARKKQYSGYDLLNSVLQKYGKNLASHFKITNWNPNDQEAFIEGMFRLGYSKEHVSKYL
jgi:hypothetical protein